MLRLLSILLLLSCLAGCTSTRFYNSLEHLPRDHELAIYNSISGVNSSVLSEFFTPKARKAVQNIPTINGIMFKPFVVGVNGWSTFAGIITLNGYSRKVVISRRHLFREGDAQDFIHEYIHHLDDMDRDGEGDWIDHREFVLAFHRLMQDTTYESDVTRYLKVADAFITNTFGIGPISEIIAYIGGWVASGHGPDYLRRVYRKILKNCAHFKDATDSGINDMGSKVRIETRF